MELTNQSKIYFIGIGGIAMSAVAGIAKQMGYEVTGSDSKEVYDPAKKVLDDLGIEFFIGYDQNNVMNSKADAFVASAGEDESNPEIKYLRDQGIEIHSFSELMHELSKDKLRIVVTGTHGKSTTSSLLGKVLETIDDSSFMTGAVLQNDDTNFHYGQGHYFVFEGDEYKALYDDPSPKFHFYKPDIVVLTNLEYDHPDLFASLEDLENEFEQLLSDMPDDGLVVYNADSANLAKLAHKNALGQVTFSMHNGGHYVAQDLSIKEDHTEFKVVRTNPSKESEVTTEDYQIKLFGEHNIANALAVIACLRTLGFEPEQIQDGFDSYSGIKRRLEHLGNTKTGALVFDDYAHHPTEVFETLKALKARYPEKKIWAIFEPHTFSRTKAVIDDLAKAFDNADQVLISEIYPARETRTPESITGQEVVDAVRKYNPNTKLVENKEQARQILMDGLGDDGVAVVMAVGSFNRLGYELIEI